MIPSHAQPQPRHPHSASAGMATASLTRSRATPPPPRINLQVLDATQQRFYLCSLALVLAALKLHSFLSPQPPPPLWSFVVPQRYNTTADYELGRWAVLDLGFVALVRWLRVPRLASGTIAAGVIGAGLVGLDYGLFGRWEVSLSVRCLRDALVGRSAADREICRRSSQSTTSYQQQSAHGLCPTST